MRQFTVITAAIGLCACGSTNNNGESRDITKKISLSEVPETVKSLVSTSQPDFVMSEVLKKKRDTRVYYDVEGELSDGQEIEFDILMGVSGPEIVEIQRDINWRSVPETAQNLINNAKKTNENVSRVIESTQTDGAIIYEVFIEGRTSDPRFEVWSKDSEFKLLSTRWQH